MKLWEPRPDGRGFQHKVLRTTNTCNVAEETSMTIETLLQMIRDMPPPLPPSPMPTRFEYDPRLPKHMGLIMSNDGPIPVGTMRLTSVSDVEITMLRKAKNTYARCGMDVYAAIEKKLSENGVPLNKLITEDVNKEVDISP